MGQARNASSGDKGQSRWKARDKAASEKGIPVPGTGGHHSWRFKWGGNRRNVAGGIHAVLHYSDIPVRDAADHNLNNAARKEVLAEQTSDALDASEDNAAAIARRLRWEDDYDDYSRDVAWRHSAEAAGMDSLADLPPNVTFNGMSADEFEPEEAYDPYDYGYEGRTMRSLECEMAEANAEILYLKDRLDSSEHLSHAYDEGWAAGVRFGRMNK